MDCYGCDNCPGWTCPECFTRWCCTLAKACLNCPHVLQADFPPGSVDPNGKLKRRISTLRALLADEEAELARLEGELAAAQSALPGEKGPTP